MGLWSVISFGKMVFTFTFLLNSSNMEYWKILDKEVVIKKAINCSKIFITYTLGKTFRHWIKIKTFISCFGETWYSFEVGLKNETTYKRARLTQPILLLLLVQVEILRNVAHSWLNNENMIYSR